MTYTFHLHDTEGNQHGVEADGNPPATVVVFTCNHCPYALAWHDRLIEVAGDYHDGGVKTLAINPNDSERYPRDSEKAMRERVQRGEFDGVPYLRDALQEVARAYDARTTPDVFVLDADLRLRYRGAPDGDHGDPSLRAAWLREALDAVLEGREPEPARTNPVGCSIKWLP
jgi:hypothetical protein